MAGDRKEPSSFKYRARSTNSSFFFHVHRGIQVPVEPVKWTGNGYNLTVNWISLNIWRLTEIIRNHSVVSTLCEQIESSCSHILPCISTISQLKLFLSWYDSFWINEPLGKLTQLAYCYSLWGKLVVTYRFETRGTIFNDLLQLVFGINYLG